MIPILLSFIIGAIVYAWVLSLMLLLLQTKKWWAFLLCGSFFSFVVLFAIWLSNRIDQVIK